ncbi:MAG: glycosyltransferase family 9 protein [Elusimicrobiales bacterium]
MNFLIIVYKGIGDVILTTPLVKAIKKNFPSSKVFFLTKKYSSTILKNNPYVDEIIVREEMRLIDLMSKGIDVSIDTMLSSSSAFFSLLSGAKKRVAFFRNWGFLVYNCMIKSQWHGYNVIKRLEYLKVFGIDWRKIKDIKPEIYPAPCDFENVKKTLERYLIYPGRDKIVSFDITSPRKERQLPADIFIYCADRLVEMGFKSLFMPAAWDYEYVISSIKRYSSHPDRYVVIKDFSILELSAAISFADIHIGTSSAPMHIAVAFDVPTFTLYTPQVNPISWNPPFPHHRWIQSEISKIDKFDVWKAIERQIDTLNL